MSSTYSVVKERSGLYWCFERVALVVEYKDDRLVFPSPLSLLQLAYSATRCLALYKDKEGAQLRGFKIKTGPGNTLRCNMREGVWLRRLLVASALEAETKLERRVASVQRLQGTLEVGIE